MRVVRALSIRQPWAELILRGVKTVEYRSRPTRVVGERFWIYAAKKEWPVAGGRWPGRKGGVWSRDLAAAGEGPPAGGWGGGGGGVGRGGGGRAAAAGGDRRVGRHRTSSGRWPVGSGR